MSDEHAAHDHPEPNYFAIFIALGVLTILEIGAAMVDKGPTYTPMVAGAILCGLAVIKAALVALYFMHLRFEKTTLGLICLTPLVLCVFLLFLLLPDLTGIPHATAPELIAEMPADHGGGEH